MGKNVHFKGVRVVVVIGMYLPMLSYQFIKVVIGIVGIIGGSIRPMVSTKVVWHLMVLVVRWVGIRVEEVLLDFSCEARVVSLVVVVIRIADIIEVIVVQRMTNWVILWVVESFVRIVMIHIDMFVFVDILLVLVFFELNVIFLITVITVLVPLVG